jgi:predicted transglutaminase-like cysteine proteinase
MRRTAARSALILALTSAACLAGPPTSLAGEPIVYASIGPNTSIPFGWLDFCRRYRGECASDGATARDLELSAKAYKEIQRVNAAVNHAIEPVSDADHWGVVDQWDYPKDGKGDCEDFALVKRRMLIDLGFPRQALLMTVVKEANGDGHAVLTIKTNRGELVLDNMTDVIKSWTTTPYRFVKRQSQADQNVWVTIGEPTTAPLYVSR